jgi:hypothetical protein
MSKLILVRAKKAGIEALEFNPKVTLDTLSHDCSVFCFVIGKSDLNQELRTDLQALGEEYGKNLFVGFWDMADYQFQNVKSEYDIDKIPCILLTALEKYSGIQDDQCAFVKVPDRLLKSEHTEQTKELIRQLYLSFINGDIQRAASQAKRTGHKVFLIDIVNKLGKLTEKFLRLVGEIGLQIEYGGAKVIFGKDAEESEDDTNDKEKEQ